ARDHTERMLAGRGVELAIEDAGEGGRRVRLHGRASLPGARVRVPGDFSASAFFLAAAATQPGSAVTAENVSLNPTRVAFLDVLERMGARVRRMEERIEQGEPVGTVTVEGTGDLRGFDVPAAWVPRMIDEVPAWAVVAACARGRSSISGAAELRVKESDRLAILASRLGSLGITTRERPDGLEIEGGA